MNPAPVLFYIQSSFQSHPLLLKFSCLTRAPIRPLTPAPHCFPVAVASNCSPTSPSWTLNARVIFLKQKPIPCHSTLHCPTSSHAYRMTCKGNNRQWTGKPQKSVCREKTKQDSGKKRWDGKLERRTCWVPGGFTRLASRPPGWLASDLRASLSPEFPVSDPLELKPLWIWRPPCLSHRVTFPQALCALALYAGFLRPQAGVVVHNVLLNSSSRLVNQSDISGENVCSC